MGLNNVLLYEFAMINDPTPKLKVKRLPGFGTLTNQNVNRNIPKCTRCSTPRRFGRVKLSDGFERGPTFSLV